MSEENNWVKESEEYYDCIDCFILNGQLVCFKYSDPDTFFYNDENGKYIVYPVTEKELKEIKRLGLNRKIS